jgi:hypothetical protein
MMNERLVWRWVVATAVLVTSGWFDAVVPARASELGFLQVAQPIYNVNEESVRMFRLTYAVWSGSASPGAEIGYTCQPNSIPGGSEPRNYNVSNLLGFRVELEDRSDEKTWKSRPPSRRWPKGATVVDTLGVTLDLSETSHRGSAFAKKLAQDTGVDIDGVSITLVVEVTIECILDNARESIPPIEYVRLAVVGDTAFAGRSGVFRVGAPRNPQ